MQGLEEGGGEERRGKTRGTDSSKRGPNTTGWLGKLRRGGRGEEGKLKPNSGSEETVVKQGSCTYRMALIGPARSKCGRPRDGRAQSAGRAGAKHRMRGAPSLATTDLQQHSTLAATRGLGGTNPPPYPYASVPFPDFMSRLKPDRTRTGSAAFVHSMCQKSSA